MDHLLRNVREGSGGAMVLRGEAGIGKTLLLDQAAASAPDMQVARVVGVEAELEFGFAALHRLLLPFSPTFEQLPDPQRHALSCAFGLVAGVAPDSFIVSLAAMALLTAAASQQPLLCIVDDAQWLDQASIGVLAFVARRLHCNQIAMLFAVREPAGVLAVLDGFTDIILAGLAAPEALDLLSSVAGAPVDQCVADRLRCGTGGNPLALVELGRRLSSDELSGASPLPDPLPVGRRLEDYYQARTAGLAPDLRALLLLASAEPSGDPALIWQAAQLVGLGPAVADLPQLEAMVKIASRVEFRHPLIRSAVYHGASALSRQRAHQALANASDPRHDADLRAWHLAAAADGPDEGVASELERSAARARDRGGWAAAATWLGRAAVLTPDNQRRAIRRVEAASAELAAGAPRAAALLLKEAAPALSDPRQRAEAARLQAWVRFELGEGAPIAAELLAAAQTLVPLDLPRACEVLLEAWKAALHAGPATGGVPGNDIARITRQMLSPGAVAESAGELLLDGFARRDEDYPTAAGRLRRAIRALTEDDATSAEDLRWIGLGCLAAYELWDDEAMRALSRRGVGSARAQGALTAQLELLSHRAAVEQLEGRFDAAEATLDEGRAISAQTGSVGVFGSARVLELGILARRGDAEQARAVAAAAMQAACERAQAGMLNHIRTAMAVLELGLGNHEAAFISAVPVVDEDCFPHGTVILPDFIEAAVISGESAAARAALARLHTRAMAGGTELGRGLLARSEALLAGPAEAEACYSEAIERLHNCRAACELARAHLLYGEWLRGRRCRPKARDHLCRAEEMFTSIGAAAFAERARVGLRGSERAQPRPANGRGVLTLHEMKIALMACQGASNADIAAALYVSPSTVAYHLRKVFVKLNIQRRAQLARALGDRPHHAELAGSPP